MKAQQAQIFDLPFFGPEFRTAWENWLQYRKERKLAKYVPTGLKATFSKLIKDSHNNEQKAVKIIENAISCNWHGLHGLKEEIVPGITKEHHSINTNQFMKRKVEAPLREMTDEEMMEWINGYRGKENNILFLSTDIYDYLEKKGLWVLTEKQWNWCLKKAIPFRKKELADNEKELNAFREMEDKGEFTGHEASRLKDLAKKIGINEYLKK